jgi:hypothetical protein
MLSFLVMIFSLEQLSFLGQSFSLVLLFSYELPFSLELPSFLELPSSLVLLFSLVEYSFSFKYFSLVFTISF